MDSSFSGEDFKKQLIEAGFITPADVKGCSEEEILQVMNWQNVDFLPTSYIEYLRAMGHSYDYCMPFFLCGEVWGQKRLQHGKEQMIYEAEAAGYKVSSDAFVFMNYYQGYYWFFFYTSEKNDNPPVFMYHESQGLIKLGESFIAFLLERYDALKAHQQREDEQTNE